MVKKHAADFVEPKKTLTLEAFIADVERRAQELDLTVTRVEHPLASGKVHNGAFSGFVCEQKDSARAQLSSGEWLD